MNFENSSFSNKGSRLSVFLFLIFFNIFNGLPSEASVRKINCKVFLQREVSTLSWVGRPLKGDGGNTRKERRGEISEEGRAFLMTK